MRPERPPSQFTRTIAEQSLVPARVGAWVNVARLMLFASRFAGALLPPAAVVSVYAALSLFRVFEVIPGWLHWSLLGALGGALLGALWLGARSFRLPSRNQAVAKLEADSGLTHRPVSHLEDRQASNLVDPMAAKLWQLHRARLLRSIGPLSIRWPESGLARRDPYAIRLLILFTVLAGLGLAWDDSSRRLVSGFFPRSQSHATSQLLIEAWITPPSYTRLPPIALAPESSLTGADQMASNPIDVPVGSKLLIQVRGQADPATLEANNQTQELQVVDPATQRIELELRKGDAITVAAGGTTARWPIHIVPDMAPSASLEEPRSTERGVLRLIYGATDDFGVVDARLYLTRKGKSIDLPVPIHALDPRQVKGSTFQDFTAHPWAGLDVELRIAAKDALGQVGASAPRMITLPERHFFHPVARAIIALRKKLSSDPAEAPSVARGLRLLKRQPDAFDHDVATYLALDFAARRLDSSTGNAGEIDAVEQLMWDTALALEDGGVSLAMRELRRLQRALEEALANGASDEEIQRLMNELQQAMNEYLQQLQQQIAKALEKGMQFGALDQNSIMLSQQDLNDMLNQARRMAESGARDSARQMLDQLQNMLENMQMGMPMMGDRDSQAQRMLGDLGRILRQQQQLLEDTFRMQRDRQPGGDQGDLGQGPSVGSPNEQGQGAMRQDALRQMLGDLMRRFSNMTGDLPQGMGQAEQSMRGASDALRGDQLDEAARAQNDALQNLQQSLQQMSEMMRQQIGSRRGQGQRDQMDPFGRALSEQEGPGGDAVARENQNRVPLDQDLDRSRQLFEELRLRRNQTSRPKLERDYIDRLLRQF